MIEYKAGELRVGDEYTKDDGENWKTVKTARAFGFASIQIFHTDGSFIQMPVADLVVVR